MFPKNNVMLLIVFSVICSCAVCAGCVYPNYPDCRNVECKGLPSYPTFEFEACLTNCDNNYNALLTAYYACLDAEQQQPPEPSEPVVTDNSVVVPPIEDECKGIQSSITSRFVPKEQLPWGCDNTCFDDNDELIPCDGRTVTPPETLEPEPVEVKNGPEVSGNDVNIAGLKDTIKNQFGIINDIFKDAAGRNAIITSGVRPKGTKFSYHETGNAIDLRIKDLSSVSIFNAYYGLKDSLSDKGYDVCLELPEKPYKFEGCFIQNSQPHIHLEYDQRRVDAQYKYEKEKQEIEAGAPIKPKYPAPPPPIVFNHEIEPCREPVETPEWLKEWTEAFQGKQILIDETIPVLGGIDVRVSTSAQDVAVWGGEMLRDVAQARFISYAVPYSAKRWLVENVRRQVDWGLVDYVATRVELLDKANQVIDTTRISGKYEQGPATIEILSHREILGEPDNSNIIVKLFRFAYEDTAKNYQPQANQNLAGKAVLETANPEDMIAEEITSLEMDYENSRVYARIDPSWLDGNSLFIVGVFNEEGDKMSTSSNTLTVLAYVLVLIAICIGILFWRARKGRL